MQQQTLLTGKVQHERSNIIFQECYSFLLAAALTRWTKKRLFRASHCFKTLSGETGATTVQPHLAGTITEDSLLPFASALRFTNGIFANRAVVPRYANTARGRGSTRGGHFTSRRSFPFPFSRHFGCGSFVDTVDFKSEKIVTTQERKIALVYGQYYSGITLPALAEESGLGISSQLFPRWMTKPLSSPCLKTMA